MLTHGVKMAYIYRILEKKLENTAKTFSATYLSGARRQI